MDDPSHKGDIEETDKINVVPLADLTLVLLIILMVLSPMISQSMIHVSTPSVKEEKNQKDKPKEENKKPPEPLIIAITTKGYSLNNAKANDLSQLMIALHARLTEEPERPVLVTAANNVKVGPVVEVLDLAKQNGALRVSLLKTAEEEAVKR